MGVTESCACAAAVIERTHTVEWTPAILPLHPLIPDEVVFCSLATDRTRTEGHAFSVAEMRKHQ